MLSLSDLPISLCKLSIWFEVDVGKSERLSIVSGETTIVEEPKMQDTEPGTLEDSSKMKTTKEMEVIQTGTVQAVEIRDLASKTFMTDLPPSAQIVSSERTVTSVK